MAKAVVLKIIRLYQATLSPDHGWFRARFPNGYCKFTPDCSEYSYQAIEKYGVFWGGGLGIWRIVRCNPWSKGGDDPIPRKFQITNIKLQTNSNNQNPK